MASAQTAAEQVLLAVGSRDFGRIRELVTDDFVDHGAPPGSPQGLEGYISALSSHAASRRIRYEVHDVVVAGDRVAIRATVHGVHGSDVPAGGRRFAMASMHLYRAEGGRIAEHWGARDEHGMAEVAR